MTESLLVEHWFVNQTIDQRFFKISDAYTQLQHSQQNVLQEEYIPSTLHFKHTQVHIFFIMVKTYSHIGDRGGN